MPREIEEIASLKAGDLIRHKHGDGSALVITNNYGDRATAVRTMEVTNPHEWLLVATGGELV